MPGHCSSRCSWELWWPEILSNLKSKKLLGVVSVHNCSLRRPIISEGLSCICTNNLPRFQQGIAGSSLAVSLSIIHPFSWLLKPDATGARALEVRIARRREMTAAGADEPVPLALTNHMFELAVFYAVRATSLRHFGVPRRLAGSSALNGERNPIGQKAPCQDSGSEGYPHCLCSSGQVRGQKPA